MQGQLSCVNRFTNCREGHQVLQAVIDDGPFKLPDPAWPIVGARAYAFGYRFDLRHPLADEVAFCQWGRVAGVSRYAAATGMAQHHDVLDLQRVHAKLDGRSEEHTSELQSLMRISYAVFCLKKQT